MNIIKQPKSNFSTFSIKGNDYIRSSHLFLGPQDERELIAEDTFELLQTVYDEFGGFKSFKNIDRYINDSYLWYITYDGPKPALDTFDVNKVYAISVYRNKYGLKGVAIARKPFSGPINKGSERYKHANIAFDNPLRFVMKRGWCEVSDEVEHRLYKLFGYHGVIDPHTLIEHKIFRNIEISDDGLHYSRPLRKGEVPTEKIAYGTIRI